MTNMMNYEDLYVSDKIWIDSESPRWSFKRFELFWIDSEVIRFKKLIKWFTPS